jgi:hypothetical protein
MSAPANPYAPPAAHVADVAAPTSAEEEIRREHLKHEASIRSVGLLYILSSAVMVIAGFALLYLGSLPGEPAPLPDGLAVVMAVIYLGLGVFSFIVGRAVRQFRSWARIAVIVLSALGLFGFPVGTIVHGYILWLMLSAKGRSIFEPDYPAIVAATPHIKYRTPIVVWIVLGILFLAMLAAVMVAATKG